MNTKELNDILEMMDQPASVVTTDTHDILFMNSAARGFWGVEGDTAGRHCWDTMRNEEKPCEPCHMCRIQPVRAQDWSYENKIKGKVLNMCTRMVDYDPDHPCFVEVTRPD